jgi:hypothetical protein
MCLFTVGVSSAANTEYVYLMMEEMPKEVAEKCIAHLQ